MNSNITFKTEKQQANGMIGFSVTLMCKNFEREETQRIEMASTALPGVNIRRNEMNKVHRLSPHIQHKHNISKHFEWKESTQNYNRRNITTQISGCSVTRQPNPDRSI